MNTLQPRKSEAGFTLVELAIVMVIIGLLIGGILKGQELIANAKVTATIGQINGVDGALSTFRDKYGVLPGDMTNGDARIPNCNVALCGAPGDGNGRIDDRLVGILPIGADENANAFRQMAAADLLSGISSEGAVTFGDGLPAGKLGGGFFVGFTPTGAIANFASAGASAGHYLTYTGALADVGPNGGVITASQAATIDRKMDDGLPDSGVIRGNTGGAAPNACITGAAPAEVYDEANNALCSIVIRTQG